MGFLVLFFVLPHCLVFFFFFFDAPRRVKVCIAQWLLRVREG